MPSWTEYEWLLKSRRGAEYMAARAPLVNRFYWKYVPTYYRWAIRRRMRKAVDFNAPIDPIKIVFVNPEKISRFSGRKDAGQNRWQSIGEIQSGNWDTQLPNLPDVPSYLQHISVADRVENTILYKSMKNHFVDHVPWLETELVKRAFRGIENGHQVLQSTSKRGALERCKYLDEIYEQITKQGYKTQLELLDNRKNLDRVGYLDLITDEISVDIGRDGELLFVDGRHRLIIAKIIGLNKVPVTILIRHKEWVKNCGEQEELVQIRHPDINRVG